ncbi:dienelactone hydrolase family protein [Rhizobium sp. TH2]|uniref:dienelactone hydrolase family protein n=1 Tax=Rhizobium sp. TH2 TaxID=2775403 RepID=UPI0021577138|nr:dienelactone hydrolase family protein [Rhizobium sp. TH2]UVC09343.1 dienelactone hydrolase family protein [Rhizobium sp. TH2]
MEHPKITQAMISAYDEYTHLTLDRRDFMRKLRALAGSGAAAAAIAPMLAASKAAAEVIPENDDRLTTTDLTYRGAPGDIKAYAAMPKDATKLPAVIVIHENRGLNAHIKDVTRRLALEGFLAMAPDMLSPSGGTPEDEDKAREMIGAITQDIYGSNLVAAVEFLKGHQNSTGNVGAIGFCWGGGQVNRLATLSPDLKAGVAYYGAQVPAEEVPKISAALMLHYAGLDDRINKGIDAYKAALEANKKDFQIFVYDGVNHAFNNDTSSARYNRQAADLAWSRTVEFLKQKLA